jgi:hypothetical protein
MMRCKLVAVLGVVALLAGSAAAQVNVTFRLNTCTVYAHDITAESMVQVRGSILPITWDDSSVDMVNQGGDIWEVVVTFDASEVGNTLEYKFYAEDWEGGDNKQLVLDQDVVLDLAYFNQGYTPPYDETADIDLWFRVSMESNALFDPETGAVGMRGAGVDDLSWDTSLPLDREDESYYFSGQATAPPESAGVEIQYKFVVDGETVEWESIDNRTLTIPAEDMTVVWVWWNNEEPSEAVIDTGDVMFQADMTTFLAEGWFEPPEEWISVRGNFEGWSNEEPMLPSFEDANIYQWTYTIIDEIGATQSWKFKAFPDENWIDSGWEGGDNHEFAFMGADTLPPREPNILPQTDPLNVDAIVRFSVDVSEAVNYFTGEPFPMIESVWLAGDDGIGPLEWPTWAVDDTVSMVRLYDNGTNGDQVAGDEIWTIDLLMPEGTSGTILYKYGIYYPGVEDVPGAGAIPMDNEAGFANNHSAILDSDEEFQELPTDIFGDQSVYEIEGAPVPGAMVLGHNWPNPFADMTVFRYDLPAAGKVDLAVYDLSGRKICTIHSGEQTAGVYMGRWNGRTTSNNPVSAGTYLIRLDTSQGSASRKVVVLR